MDILEKCDKFYVDFKGEKGVLAKTEKGRKIYYFAVQKTQKPVIIVQCAMHAREYITAHLCLKLIEDFSRFGKCGSVYFIPIMNPDGVNICLRQKPLYKANARGVDLNVNFDARWGKGEKNLKLKGDENYIGERPFSEIETKVLRDFTLAVNPNLTLSYHSKGEEIYYFFHQRGKLLKNCKCVAKITADCTGYTVKKIKGSVGGYKDWCIEKLKIPALTIEVGDDELSHPITEENLEEIYQKNKSVILNLTDSFGELWN